MKTLLGYFFIALPFIVVIGCALYSVGLRGTLTILGAVVFVVGSISLGVYLSEG